jgi:hypothetical protein
MGGCASDGEWPEGRREGNESPGKVWANLLRSDPRHSTPASLSTSPVTVGSPQLLIGRFNLPSVWSITSSLSSRSTESFFSAFPRLERETCLHGELSTIPVVRDASLSPPLSFPDKVSGSKSFLGESKNIDRATRRSPGKTCRPSNTKSTERISFLDLDCVAERTLRRSLTVVLPLYNSVVKD